jgi:cell division protein FtsZ
MREEEEQAQFAMQPQAYDGDLDEPAPSPRQIPAHLQQPLRPQAQKPRATGRTGSGLFADPPRAEQAPPPRRSLFGIVTGAIRSSLPTAAAPADTHASSSSHQDADGYEQAAEPVRANVRPAMGEEMGIDIPAFLRRQSS